MRLPRSNKISRRNRANREKGVRFERRMRRLFELEGYTCRRILEFDGHRRGQDLALFRADGTELPIIIQVKSTKNPRDLSVGLSEALEHNPDGRIFISVWHFNRTSICLILDRDNPAEPVPVSLQDVFKVIGTAYPAERTERTVTAAAESFRSHNFLRPFTAPPASPVRVKPAEQPSPENAAPAVEGP